MLDWNSLLPAAKDGFHLVTSQVALDNFQLLHIVDKLPDKVIADQVRPDLKTDQS